MTKQGEIRKTAQEVMNTPLAMAHLFFKPKCKPWDIVKGRRFPCCHWKVENGHMKYCHTNFMGKTLMVPQCGEITAGELINAN